MRFSLLRAASADLTVSAGEPALVCRWCGQVHQAIRLARGESARCVRCGTVLALRGRFGRDAALAYTITGMVLAVPAVLLPFATLAKFGGGHDSLLFTGIVMLWRDGMGLLAVWASVCGTIAPLLLLGIIAGLLLPVRLGWTLKGNEALVRTAQVLEHWSMPEVHILAVLVAFAKLGSLVHVTIGAGLWCYAGMSLALLLAWRSFDLAPPGFAPLSPRAAGASP